MRYDAYATHCSPYNIQTFAHTRIVKTGVSFLIATVLLLCAVPMVFSVHAAVLLNEVFPKPSDEVSEWIELYNTGSEDVALDGWALADLKGDKKIFTFPQDSIIHPGSFLTVFKSLTQIDLDNEGDTVLLFDSSGVRVDDATFPSTLGYNTSIGRNINGGGDWAVCVSHSFNEPNTCPLPTSTPSPTNTPTSTPTHTPTPTKASIPVVVVTIPPDDIAGASTFQPKERVVRESGKVISPLEVASDSGHVVFQTPWYEGVSGVLMAAGGIGLVALVLIVIVFELSRNRRK